jgi:threonine dehydratase
MISTHECTQDPEAIFIHPGATQAALAGNATIALEIVEEMPDVDCIVVPYGSGSVCTGIACGIRQLANEPGNEKVRMNLIL